jgi:transcriptional regulator with XRE-family HTH domain
VSLLESFGKRLKQLREERELTQEMLAERVGIQPRQINYLEHGKKWTKPDTLERLAKALDVKVKDLFDFPEE